VLYALEYSVTVYLFYPFVYCGSWNDAFMLVSPSVLFYTHCHLLFINVYVFFRSSEKTDHRRCLTIMEGIIRTKMCIGTAQVLERYIGS
jgi:hypothetical protein